MNPSRVESLCGKDETPAAESRAKSGCCLPANPANPVHRSSCSLAFQLLGRPFLILSRREESDWAEMGRARAYRP